MRSTTFVAILFLLATALSAGPAGADDRPGLSTGQLVYVPAYAHIYHGTQKKPFFLSITLSVRNTDTRKAITVTAMDYYDTAGAIITSYLKEPVTIGPLETVEMVVEEKGESGGSGDNFLVRWKSDQPVNPPLVEAVMIGTASAQGISFTSRGVVIQE